MLYDPATGCGVILLFNFDSDRTSIEVEWIAALTDKLMKFAETFQE
jgi:hypothetical protein